MSGADGALWADVQAARPYSALPIRCAPERPTDHLGPMTSTAPVLRASSSSSQGVVADLDGLVGFAARVIDALGEWGVALLTFVETVFPPIPSEVILPLAGFLAGAGSMDIVLLVALSTLGAYLGALVLYGLGAGLGLDRSIRWLAKLPLVDRHDFEKAAGWFERHGRSAVFFGRFIPGVRSLISLPAGAERMPLLVFSLFTIIGSGIWNGLLIGLGAALGTQYELIDQYAKYLDYAVYAAIAGVVVFLVVRSVRRRRAGVDDASRDAVDQDVRG
ncbi:membrane protein DedA with SNARE-associated domain [Frigoribacterium sp. PvP054]